MLQLVVGRPHCNAKRLELVRAGDAAAVVVGKDCDGASDEAAVEHALAGHEEVVSVDKSDHGQKRCMQAVTFPK